MDSDMESKLALYFVLLIMLALFIPIASTARKTIHQTNKLPDGFKAFIIFFSVLTLILGGWKWLFMPLLIIPVLASLISIPIDKYIGKKHDQR